MPLASDVPYEIGDYAFGGYVAGLIDTTRPGSITSDDVRQGGLRYVLIVAPKALETAGQHTNIDDRETGTHTRWDGLHNTDVLVNSVYPSSAAQHCANQSRPADAGSDWYLPALDELELLYRAFKPDTSSNNTGQATGDEFAFVDFGVNPSSDPTGVAYTAAVPGRTNLAAWHLGGGEAFVRGFYWTSTDEGSVSYARAWTQSFFDGEFEGRNKDNIYGRIRPVRRVLVADLNDPPNAPILLAPADDAVLNPGKTNRFELEPSDPNPGDTTSQTEWRYRPIGTTAWATVLQPQPITYWDSPAGTFTTGLGYEWQARTFDAAGEPGPWSTSGFFSTAPPPPGPIITEPTDGATIPTQSAIYRWSTPDQDAHEIVVTDSTGAEHVRLGPLTNGSRSASVGGLENGETYTFAIRVQHQGLWSEWVTVTNPVSYTPPATPTVAVDDFTVAAAILVRGDAPLPAGSEPTVTYFDVYRREATDTGDGIRRAQMLAPGAVFTDHLVRLGGVEYHYRVLAHGDNGTTAWSAWSGQPEPVYELLEGGSPSSTGGETLSGGPI